jgi:hypothetical protein
MEMRTGSVLFPPVRGSGPQTTTQTFNFPREVERAVAGLVGYTAGFNGDDHHLGQLDVKLSTEVDSDVVIVTGTFGLRDWSGEWDDNYTGTIQFVLLADLVPITTPPPRPDLDITGMEITQAIQHFRSAQHLDLPNVRPDNSIRLVARKSTGIRVYVDYNPGTGLPPINTLSGELEVTTSIGSTTFTLPPVNTMSPRRDNQINRANVNHTLNFVIPEGWCQGELVLRCRVFDQAAPLQRSEMFQRTIRFVDVAPLRLYSVGVHYTGQGLDLAAPTQANVVSTMSFVELTYPIGEVLLTGYSTIDFGVDMKADISDGCGDGFNELLDQLRDMRGDSSDVYYAVLPSGIDSGSVGGCGGGGVGAGFIGGGATAAQEIGHAFGRDHAPCDDETRCSDPGDQDSNYPHYNSFPSDSIGEFGYNPLTNTVLDPASTFDFMGYSSPNWVSPYTYSGLMSRFPATSGTSAAASALMSLRALHSTSGPPQRMDRPEWIRVKTPTLFLGLTIDRDRTVTRRPSFHYPAYAHRPSCCPSEFSVELRDKEGRVLSCQELREDCRHCASGCWPRSFRDQIPFPPGARSLQIWEGKEKIYEERIPEPPQVKLECQYLGRKDGFELRWSAAGSGKAVGPDKEAESDKKEARLWYLVQWEDSDGTWRGLGPRTQSTKIRIPLRLLGRRRSMQVRILASSGIATGMAECTLVRNDESSDDTPSTTVVTDDVDIVLTSELTTADNVVSTTPLMHVTVIEQTGRSLADPEVFWYDQSGAELGRGRAFDLRTLPEGQHVVRAVVPGQGSGVVERAWLVERSTEQGIVVLGTTTGRVREREVHEHPHRRTGGTSAAQ